ncbi:MAG TPA: hypothetical protein VFW28_13530 [Micropepsaceae bacterium]|nr:hypothetical protein [Micropepsaceae bacterium]
MVNTDRYHGYAEECRALAGQLSSEHHRRTLLAIAQEWETLARGQSNRAMANPSLPARWFRSAVQAIW